MLSLKLRALRVGAALLSLRLASEMPGITRDRFETVWHLRTLALLILRISSAEIARDCTFNFVDLMPSPQIRPTGLVFVQMIAARIVIEMRAKKKSILVLRRLIFLSPTFTLSRTHTVTW